MLNRSKTWAVVFLVATFAAGLAVGAGGRALWVRYASAAAPDRGRGLDRMMDELTEELRLDPCRRAAEARCRAARTTPGVAGGGGAAGARRAAIHSPGARRRAHRRRRRALGRRRVLAGDHRQRLVHSSVNQPVQRGDGAD